MPLGLSYGQTVDVLAEMHQISSSKRVAFKGRLQHLQRLGFPPGSNTGRGKAASYDLDALVLLGAALELIQLGLGPDRAVSLLRPAEQIVLSGARAAFPSKKGKERLMFFDPRALSSLQADTAEGDDCLMVGNANDLAARFRGSGSIASRLAVIDLHGLVINLTGSIIDLGFSEHRGMVNMLAHWIERTPYHGDDQKA